MEIAFQVFIYCFMAIGLIAMLMGLIVIIRGY